MIKLMEKYAAGKIFNVFRVGAQNRKPPNRDTNFLNHEITGKD